MKKTSKNHPNLLFVFADQWRKQSLGIEDPKIITPNFDAFAKDSVYFQNAVSNCPLCSPYRGCLFTGKYPVQNGIYGNCMTGYDIALREDDIALSDVLYDQGYRTGYIGKWHLDEPELNHSDHPRSGAANWDAYTPQGPRRHHFSYWHAYNADNDHLSPHYWEDSPERIDIAQWSPIHETDKALEFLAQSSEQPFALFVSWNPPHPPFDRVPEQYVRMYDDLDELPHNVPEADRYDNQTGEPGIVGTEQLKLAMRRYYGAISGLDEQFGRLMTFLKDNDLYDNTLIVLTADHGEHLGTHGLVGKHTWYEQSVCVPLMMRYPDKLCPRREELCISTVNLPSTMLSLMDLDRSEVAGPDVSRYLVQQSRPDEDCAFLSAYVSRDIFIEAFQMLGIKPVDVGWRGIRDRRYTYVLFRGYMPEDRPCALLYDRENDPDQAAPVEMGKRIDHTAAVHLHEKLMRHLKTENPGFYQWARQWFQVSANK